MAYGKARKTKDRMDERKGMKREEDRKRKDKADERKGMKKALAKKKRR